MKKLLALAKKNEELISYLFWGVLTTVVSWGSYSLFIWFLQRFQLAEIFAVSVSNVLSWLSATVFSFVTNKLFVFNSKSWKSSIFIPEAIKFVTTRLATGALEMILVPGLVLIGLNQTIFGVQGMLSKILVSIFVVILNYIFSKIFIFKNTQK